MDGSGGGIPPFVLHSEYKHVLPVLSVHWGRSEGCMNEMLCRVRMEKKLTGFG